MQPLVICAAVTGGGPPKSAGHPVTPEAVVASALEAWRAGAAMLHLHARQADGSTTMRSADYAAMVQALRRQGCDAVISLSAGDDGGRASHQERVAVCDAGSELVSLALGSFNFGARLYDNRPAFGEALAARIAAVGSRPDYEVFDTGHLQALARQVETAGRPAWVTLALGVPGCMPADERLLPWLVKRLPPRAHWAVSVHGGDHERFVRVGLAAFALGGHIRTGLEDHPSTRPGEPAASNAAMVAQWADVARTWGRPLATPAQVRELLGLPPAGAPEGRDG